MVTFIVGLVFDNVSQTFFWSPSPGWALRRHVFKKSAVKKMSTSQKKSRTFPPFQARAPTSSPRPRENSSFSWISVKLRKFSSLQYNTLGNYNMSLTDPQSVIFMVFCEKAVSNFQKCWCLLLMSATACTSGLTSLPQIWALFKMFYQKSILFNSGHLKGMINLKI